MTNYNPRLSKGVEKFLEFHKLEPKRVNKFAPSMKVSPYMYYAGRMIDICYRSSKWENNPNDYKHDHDYGVCLYLPKKNEDENTERTPNELLDETCFVKLGNWLSLRFESEEEDGRTVEINAYEPYPELYCTPNGKYLLIIDKKKKLMACIWGGFLGVEARGIVG